MNNHEKFAALDGLRGIAAMFVVLRHTQIFWGFYIYRSYLAVDIFFILSGFVIGHAYDRLLTTNSLGGLRFIAIRLIRFYPIYLLSLVLASINIFLELHNVHALNSSTLIEGAKSALLAAFFIPSHAFGKSDIFPLNGPYWSLFFELLVNIAYAIFATRLTNARIVAILAVAALGLTFSAWHHENLDVGFFWDSHSWVAGLSRSTFGFFLGLLLFRIRPAVIRVNSSVAPAVSIAAMCTILASPSVGGHSDALVDLVCVCLVFPILILMAAAPNVGALQRSMLFLGAASYPLYVFHLPAGQIVWAILGDRISAFAPLSGMALLICLIVVSAWAERRIDVPIRRFLVRRYLNIRSSQAERSALAS